MNLFNAKLSAGQVLALYTQMSRGTKLRLVSMGHVDIRWCDPDTVTSHDNNVHSVVCLRP